MIKKSTLALMLSTAMLTAACGGGGGDSGGAPAPGPSDGGSTPPSATVTGPLDPVQNALTQTVFSPLVAATADTPLQGVLLCANGIATRNLLDIADAFANGLAQPSTLVATTPAQARAATAALVGNLFGLLTAFNGERTCQGGATPPLSAITLTNPLADTPLAPLGQVLVPVLLAASQQLTNSGNGGTPELSATQLSTLLTQISNAFSFGLSSLPANVLTAPIVGGTLITVDEALTELAALAGQASGGASPQALASSLQATAENIIGNLLTRVLPASNLQDLAGDGASSDVVAQLQAAVAALTAGLATDPTTRLPANPLAGEGFAALDTLLDTLVAALPEALAGSAGLTALEVALNQVQTLLGSLLGIGGGGGSGECRLGLLGLCLVP